MSATLQSPAATRLHCYHCGNDCPPTPFRGEEAAHVFCCEGCVTVFHLLKDLNLQNYYSLNAQPGSRISDESLKGKYDFLDEPETCNRLCEYCSEKANNITFQIPAIHCSSCIWLLEKLFLIKEGIQRSEVNFLRKELYLTFDPSVIKLSQVAELLASLGYAPHLTLDATKEKVKRPGNRSLWFKLGIAGFSFGNIMMLSFPEYLGLSEDTFTNVFGWLNFAFALPVLLFSASDYFRSAWIGLRNKQINMDVPLALGMVVLFGRSTWEVATHSGAGYFDSFAGLLFFLLLGKAFQARTWDALSFDRDYKSYFPLSVTTKEGAKERIIPVSQVKPGMILVARNGELIPADGILRTGEGRLDYSFVSGESDPVKVIPGEKIFAGGKQAGQAIEVVVTREVSQSYLARLWNHETFNKPRESEVTQLATRVGRNFTWRLLLIAVGAAAFWLYYQPERTAEVVTAVLIVACPCALALSTPFTLGNVLRIFGRNGFYLKGAAVVEHLAEGDTLVFDKTGTLTHAGDSQVNWEGEALTDADRAHLHTLFSQSVHPLSRRLVRNLPEGNTTEITDYEEQTGKGLTGRVNGKLFVAGRRSFVEQMLFGVAGEKTGTSTADGAEVWVGIENKLVGRFTMRDAFRDTITGILPSLGKEYKIAIVSGDNDRERERLSVLLPQGSQLEFQQSPEGKLNFVRDLQKQGSKVIMVGDGLNDAGALRQSEAGISVSEETGTFTPSSDAILSAAALGKLGDFLRFSKSSLRTIRASFLLSLIYNLTGIAFAVSGHLSPLVAAILMPMSSLSVILFTAISTNIKARRLGL